MSTPIYAGSRVVGVVDGAIFRKRVKSSNFIRIPPSIGFSIDSLRQAQDAGADRVHVVEVSPDGKPLRNLFAFIEVIRAKGINKSFNGEPQKALQLDLWRGTVPEAQQVMRGLQAASRPPETPPAQGTLF